jgi:hypothetical protein
MPFVVDKAERHVQRRECERFWEYRKSGRPASAPVEPIGADPPLGVVLDDLAG